MAGITPESPKRPAHWRFITLREVKRGKFTVSFPHTGNPIDAMLRDLVGLEAGDKTDCIPFDAAVAVGERIEQWLDCRPEEKPQRKERSAPGTVGTITKIHPPKKGKKFNATFIRVEFDMAGTWAKTDLVPTYKNFARWKPLLAVGAILGGLRLRGIEVDADSEVFREEVKATELSF